MTCKKKHKQFAIALAAGAALLAGCGNYSNEDLEYMNALPERGDLEANLPQAQSAVLAQTAELYRLTHDVTRIFNGTADAFLRLIDFVRAHSPSSRTENSRTWGPSPSKENPGWMVKMKISRVNPTATSFSYWLGFLPVANRTADPIILIAGTFDARGGIRGGTGAFDVTTDVARASGIALDLGFLDKLHVDYDTITDTVTDPIMVHMEVTHLDNPLKPDEIKSAVYDYGETRDHRGAMSFDFWANSIPGPAVEKFHVTSRWLGDGSGRSDVEVVEGDGAGAKQAQCWDRHFQPTYTNKPWSPAENLGDPSACPDIPAL
jgi:hypothetical protein